MKQTGLGVVQFLVFLAFQFGVLNVLGSIAWLVGVIVFAVILYLIGRVSMPRRGPPQIEELWRFTVGFAVVLTAIYALGAPFLGAMMPSGMSITQVTSLVLGFWLIVFGAAMFVTGWTARWGVTTAVGIIWAFSAMFFATAVAVGNYFDFALLTGFPFIIYGLITKG